MNTRAQFHLMVAIENRPKYKNRTKIEEITNAFEYIYIYIRIRQTLLIQL